LAKNVKTETLRVGDIIRSPLFANHVWNGDADDSMRVASEADFKTARQHDQDLEPVERAAAVSFLVYSISGPITGGGWRRYSALPVPPPDTEYDLHDLFGGSDQIWFHAEVVPEVELLGRLELKVVPTKG
jgi:hypothetical protein